MAGPEKQSVRVTIHDRSYTVIVTGDARELHESAASVDSLMNSIQSKLPNSDYDRVAVLACLHLADKLRLLEKEVEELRQRKDSKSGEYAAMLERLIASVEELSS